MKNEIKDALRTLGISHEAYARLDDAGKSVVQKLAADLARISADASKRGRNVLANRHA